MILDNEGIEAYLKRCDSESKAIKEEILRLVWCMRGGVSYDDAMLLSEQERQIIGKIASENIEIAKKSNLAYF